MRYDRNFHPEWGYVAAAPSVMRTVRLIAVAAIIGATASAATVFSLLDRPVAEESVAARTLVTPDPGRPLTSSTSSVRGRPRRRGRGKLAWQRTGRRPGCGCWWRFLFSGIFRFRRRFDLLRLSRLLRRDRRRAGCQWPPGVWRH